MTEDPWPLSIENVAVVIPITSSDLLEQGEEDIICTHLICRRVEDFQVNMSKLKEARRPVRMSGGSDMHLTDHLLTLQTTVPYADALRHPFLTSAASGSLQHERLGFWLSQDRLYAAHAYPRFIGSLISAIPYDASHKIGSIEERLNQRILDILVFSLTNVVREVTFFEETAKEWGLRIEGWKERKGTRDYTAEMARVSSSLEEGLVFLWAMEKVYLDSWVAVHTQLVSSLDATRTTPTLSALLSLSANWSSTEFSSFVDTLAGIVNDLGITPGSASWKRAEGVWDRVVELEAAFWPEEGEESSMLS